MIERPVFTGPALCALEAHEVVGLLKRDEISPAELLDASLARCGEVEPLINAIPTLCAERAKQSLGSIERTSLLSGLPIAIKDLLAVSGVRTTYGTKGLADNVPATSERLVERLESNGSVVIGKSNTPELGAGGNTFNEVFGHTSNPWNTTRNAGGSSGGAAASLATGEVWLAHGSDYAGSLRTPATYCGVVGLRPSPGRAGGGGVLTAWNTEGVQGPMARSVTDCALMLDAMSGFDAGSPISIKNPTESFLRAAGNPPEKLRIAYSPDMGGHGLVSVEVAKVLNEALGLVERNGNVVEEVPLKTAALNKTFRTLRALAFLAQYSRMPDAVRQHLKPTIMENVAYGKALSIDDIANAQISRSVIFNDINLILGKFDVIACPVVGVEAGPLSQEFPTQVDGHPLHDYLDWLRFSYLATVTGLPAISLPVGYMPDGMPMGIQLIGPNRGEGKLLAVARAIEEIIALKNTPIDPVTS
ncbi:MAG: amidase [Paracoccaceae bacterium]|jgi:amidase